MAGVGTLLKQAQKMQRGIEALQTQLAAKEIDVTSGGGAVKIKVNGTGKFLSLVLDPEFLKEGAVVVEVMTLSMLRSATRASLNPIAMVSTIPLAQAV